MLKCLCGDTAMSHLMLCTTMWDKVSQDEGYERLEELGETAWKEMISLGASTDMISSVHTNAKGEAERILNELITNASPVELAIQDEMVNQKLTVAETGAGQIITEYIREAREQVQREMHAMREAILKESAAAEAKAKAALQAQELEVERLRKEAEEMALAQQSSAERLAQEQERAAREMETLREKVGRENAADKAKLAEAVREKELEVQRLKQQAEKMAREQELNIERHRQEREKAERETEKLRETMRKESEASAVQMKDKLSAQEIELAELKRQNETLGRRRSSFPWWKPVVDIVRTFLGLPRAVTKVAPIAQDT